MDSATIYAFTCYFILSLCAHGIYRFWALKKAMHDVPNHRSLHKTPVPRGGGLGFALLIGLLFTLNQSGMFILMPLLMAVLGFLDDYQSLSPTLRLITSLLVSTFTGILIFGISTSIWLIAFIALALFCINSLNFMDGSDGHMTVLMCINSLVFAFTAYLHDDTPMAMLYLMTLAILLGFLVYNRPPANLFMGDAGSYFLGAFLAVSVWHCYTQYHIAPWLLALLYLISATDTMLTLIKRALNKEPLMTAHRSHAYQRLITQGWSHQKYLVHFALLQVGCAALFFVGLFTTISAVSLFAGSLLVLVFLYFQIAKRVLILSAQG